MLCLAVMTIGQRVVREMGCREGSVAAPAVLPAITELMELADPSAWLGGGEVHGVCDPLRRAQTFRRELVELLALTSSS